MSELTLEVRRREESGKGPNRRLRGGGDVPAVVYGGGVEPLSIRVTERSVQKLLKESGDNAVFLLSLEGTSQTRHAMVRDIQYDAINGRLVHLDFQRIDLNKKVRVSVAIELVGLPTGVKLEGGVLDFVTRSVEVLCLPMAIPPKFTLDVGELHIGQHLEAKDLVLPGDAELLDEPFLVIASVSKPRLEAEAAPAAAPEGELIEGAKQEPEVVARGKVVPPTE